MAAIFFVQGSEIGDGTMADMRPPDDLPLPAARVSLVFEPVCDCGACDFIGLPDSLTDVICAVCGRSWKKTIKIE